MKILIIEDEEELQKSMSQSLKMENFVVETESDYPSALDRISHYDYNCIILDIMLPNGNGLDILSKLKSLGKEDSVIIVSAKDSLDDKVNGLQLGADDYLSKPFHIAELNARIKAVLRRKLLNGRDCLPLSNLTIDFYNRNVFVDGKELLLNRKEYDVLAFFALNKGRLVSKTSLAEHVWGDFIDQADDFDFIYSQIKNLRKKLKDSGADVEIQAVYGIGYKLV